MFKKKTSVGSAGIPKSPASPETAKRPVAAQSPSRPAPAESQSKPSVPPVVPSKASVSSGASAPETQKKAEPPAPPKKPETSPAAKRPRSAAAKASSAVRTGAAKRPAEEVVRAPVAPSGPPSASQAASPPVSQPVSQAVASSPGAGSLDRFLSDLESRIRRAVEDLEKRLTNVAVPAVTPKPVPHAEEARRADRKSPEAGIDDVTASFQRALSEAIDRKLEEALGPAVALYQRLLEEAREIEEDPSSLRPADLAPILSDALGDLEKVLRLLGGDFIRPKVGEYYDPLIHLAVGEAGSSDSFQVPGGSRTVEGVVAEVVRPGYRSQRGMVVIPAKVVVGRR